uniref:Uncharacterized protein n=1 Tax=Globisporangium ultimum (strain ATCC 200006 / CBS 805.95 / DAOM BR144) TaxID=431595 RepID=K3WTJ2_GLOUD
MNATSTNEEHRYRRRRDYRQLEASNPDIEQLEAHFGEPLERDFDVLTTPPFASGVAKSIPWSSDYWPAYRDGINFVWQDRGEPSPSEKYAMAFDQNVQELQDAISNNNGILGQQSASSSSCSQHADCPKRSKCGIRDGEQRGVCIPKWYGICHAWTAAATMEPEPRCDVEKNGVLFRPRDIKALISQVYDGAEVDTLFTGARFDGPDDPVRTDAYGRYENPLIRDLGPSFFHLAVATIMGKYAQSFIIDIEAGSEVWNQPVRDYEVVTMELQDIETASRQWFGESTYPFNSNAKFLVYTVLRLRWIVESELDGELGSSNRIDDFTEAREYTYALELDSSKKVIGGEWLEKSRLDHPDFLWLTLGKPSPRTMTSVGIRYDEVSELVQASHDCGSITSPPAPTPSPNSATSPAPRSGSNSPAIEPTPTPEQASPAPTQTLSGSGSVDSRPPDHTPSLLPSGSNPAPSHTTNPTNRLTTQKPSQSSPSNVSTPAPTKGRNLNAAYGSEWGGLVNCDLAPRHDDMQAQRPLQ